MGELVYTFYSLLDTIIKEYKVLLDDIKATGQGVYVALCSESTKDTEPYIGVARTALNTIETGEKPTPAELKNDFGWDHITLKDFAYNEEAAHLEKTLHKKLHYHLRGQKLWIKCGAGGADPSSTNVSMSYGPLTGLVRNTKCDNVSQ